MPSHGDRSCTDLVGKREALGLHPELPLAPSCFDLTDLLAHQGPPEFLTFFPLADEATVHLGRRVLMTLLEKKSSGQLPSRTKGRLLNLP